MTRAPISSASSTRSVSSAVEFGGLAIGWREGVIALIALILAYIAIVLRRMAGLRRPPPPAAPPQPPAEAAAPPEQPAWAGRVAEQFERQRLEQEVLQLRDEVDALRGEVAALRDDMQQDLAHLQAAQAASPIYGDAMQMAAAGYDPAIIAERCGIARAEAELVAALAKKQEG